MALKVVLPGRADSGRREDGGAAPRTPVTPGRVLIASYLLFVVAAGARSAVQLATHAARAPLAYGLSAGAAGVYLAGFVLLRRVEAGGPAGALQWCSLVELTGVLGVGTLSLARPRLLGDATVWSHFGAGYLLVPLALPVAVLVRLHARRR